jgi:hypothetical protein
MWLALPQRFSYSFLSNNAKVLPAPAIPPKQKKSYFFNHSSNQVTITHIAVVVHAATQVSLADILTPDAGVLMKLHSQHFLRRNQFIQFSEPTETSWIEVVKG